jgi:valyl-tRNA synthetase
MLLKVKKTIETMSKIKDISTVDEKIESLSLSCKEFVTTAEGIFNLQPKIKQDDFVDLLTAETNRIEKSGEDVENNINNFSDYISKNILNKRILSR